MKMPTPTQINADKFTDIRDEETTKGLHEELLKIIEGDTIADLGCGAGHFSKLLPGKKFFNFDCAKRPLKNFRKVDLSSDSLGDISVDTVLLVEVLEHLENPWHAVREAKRISKKAIIITVPSVSDLFSRLYYLAFGRPPYFFFDRYVQHTQPIHHYQLRKMMECWKLAYEKERRSRKLTKTLIQKWERME